MEALETCHGPRSSGRRRVIATAPSCAPLVMGAKGKETSLATNAGASITFSRSPTPARFLLEGP